MAIIKCEFCGAEISDKANACPYCGAQRINETEGNKQSIYCEECGELLTEDMEACPKCGCPVSKPEDVKTEISSGPNELPEIKDVRKKKRIIIIAAAAAVVVLAAIIIIILCIRPGDNKSDKNEAVSANTEAEITETTSIELSNPDEDGFVGSWMGYALYDEENGLMPIPDNVIVSSIKSNGFFSLIINSDGEESKYAGTWYAEDIDGKSVCFFNDDDTNVGMGVLHDDGSLGVIFSAADDTVILLERQ